MITDYIGKKWKAKQAEHRRVALERWVNREIERRALLQRATQPRPTPYFGSCDLMPKRGRS